MGQIGHEKFEEFRKKYIDIVINGRTCKFSFLYNTHNIEIEAKLTDTDGKQSNHEFSTDSNGNLLYSNSTLYNGNLVTGKLTIKPIDNVFVCEASKKEYSLDKETSTTYYNHLMILGESISNAIATVAQYPTVSNLLECSCILIEQTFPGFGEKMLEELSQNVLSPTINKHPYIDKFMSNTVDDDAITLDSIFEQTQR